MGRVDKECINWSKKCHITQAIHNIQEAWDELSRPAKLLTGSNYTHTSCMFNDLENETPNTTGEVSHVTTQERSW